MAQSTASIPLARQVSPTDGQLLRSLMLSAAHSAGLDIEHRVFSGRTAEDWDRLAAHDPTHPGRTMFVLAHPGDNDGHGVVWVHHNTTALLIADLGWWWVRPDAEGSAAERSLFDGAISWVAHRGARTVETATNDPREEASLRRCGFHLTRLARDGERRVFARSCSR